MVRTRRKSLIPRYSYPMTTRNLVTEVATEEQPFGNNTTSYTFVRGDAEACSIQNLTDWEINNLPEGIKTNQSFKIFTNTPLYPSIEDTDKMSDSIYLPDVYFEMNGVAAPASVGGWFNVVKSSYRNVGVITHCECVIVKDHNTLSTEALEQYPDVTTLNSNITTRDDLLDSSTWLDSWEGENT